MPRQESLATNRNVPITSAGQVWYLVWLAPAYRRAANEPKFHLLLQYHVLPPIWDEDILTAVAACVLGAPLAGVGYGND